MPRKNQPGCPCCNTPVGYPCGTCRIPREDLTVSWTNFFGDGSAPLVYAGNTWTSACTDQIIYQLACVDQQVVFTVYYFISGACPDGQSLSCSTIGQYPRRLVVTGLTCSPGFLMTISLTSETCYNLAATGYTGYTISP